MNQKMKDWVLSFPCSRCAFLGVEKLGTVLVLGQDEASEIQVIAFCYECARIMMSSRRKPAPKRIGAAPTRNENRVVKLQRRNPSAASGDDESESARPRG
jgi:hypothetical protein